MTDAAYDAGDLLVKAAAFMVFQVDVHRVGLYLKIDRKSVV